MRWILSIVALVSVAAIADQVRLKKPSQASIR